MDTPHPGITAHSGSTEKWLAAKHLATWAAHDTSTSDLERGFAPWTAALCLCMRRYGVPESATLEVQHIASEGDPAYTRHIALSFKDATTARQFITDAHASSGEAPAQSPETPRPNESGAVDAWHAALHLGSELPATDVPLIAPKQREFAVRFVGNSVELRARRDPGLDDDFPLEQMLEHWEQLARGLVNFPESPVGRLSVLTPEELEALSPVENPAEPVANPRFGFELFDDQVALTPDAPAVTDGSTTINYRELWTRANRLAHHLQKLGVGPETIVGVFLERSIDLVVAVIALQKAGGAYLPIDPAYPPKRLENLISDSRVPFIVTHSRFLAKLLRGNFRAVEVDREADVIASMPAESPAHGLRPGNASYVFYTSGSTGQPKGVIMEHTVREPFDRSRVETDTLATGEKALLKSAVGFTLIIREIFWPLHWGGHLIVVPQGSDGDSAYIVRMLRDQKVVGANFVPSMLSLVVDEPEFDQCTSLRLIYTVGESLSVELQRRLFARLPNVRLFVFYGCTEAPAATFRECKADDTYGHRVVIGKPMAHKKIYLLDRNFMPVPPGVPGEIHTGGSISRGYLHRPELTADRFVPDPFTRQPGGRVYRTGDLARRLGDGNLEFLGRMDSQVQVRGIRVELGEIEAAISSHDAVKEALVMADPRNAGPTRLIAYFTEREGRQVVVSELRGLLRGQLPEYMVPSSFTRLDAFPLNANGKVDRRNLPAPKPATQEPGREIVIARTATEVRLAAIWTRLLENDDIGVTDRFFDVGGDSILATKLIAQINREFHAGLSLPDFHRKPTIENLARLISGQSPRSGLKLFIPINVEGTRTPVFMANTYPFMLRYLPADQPHYGMKGHWLDARFDFKQDVPSIAKDFLREMREIQPNGPYILLGFSMGGLFAIEMARQLENAGEELSYLLLIDPSLPNDRVSDEPEIAKAPAPIQPAHPDSDELKDSLDRHVARLRGLSLRQKLAYSWSRREAVLRWYRVLRKRVRDRSPLATGLFFNRIKCSVPFGLRNTVARHFYDGMRKAYQPKPLRSRATVFLIRERSAEREAMLRQFFPAGLDVHLLETNEHLEAMTEPHLSRWMNELKRNLFDGQVAPAPANAMDAAPPRGLDYAQANDSEQPQECRVVKNGSEQFSVWPVAETLPPGWTETGFRGDRKSCLAHIDGLWTDERPTYVR